MLLFVPVSLIHSFFYVRKSWWSNRVVKCDDHNQLSFSKKSVLWRVQAFCLAQVIHFYLPNQIQRLELILFSSSFYVIDQLRVASDFYMGWKGYKVSSFHTNKNLKVSSTFSEMTSSAINYFQKSPVIVGRFLCVIESVLWSHQRFVRKPQWTNSIM